MIKNILIFYSVPLARMFWILAICIEGMVCLKTMFWCYNEFGLKFWMFWILLIALVIQAFIDGSNLLFRYEYLLYTPHTRSCFLHMHFQFLWLTLFICRILLATAYRSYVPWHLDEIWIYGSFGLEVSRIISNNLYQHARSSQQWISLQLPVQSKLNFPPNTYRYVLGIWIGLPKPLEEEENSPKRIIYTDNLFWYYSPSNTSPFPLISLKYYKNILCYTWLDRFDYWKKETTNKGRMNVEGEFFC